MQDTGPVEVESADFFSAPPPARPPQPPRPDGPGPGDEPPHSKPQGVLMLTIQALLSALALFQLWRTQMLPALYLAVFALLLALCWLLVRHGLRRRPRPSLGARLVSVVLSASLALGCVWAQQGLAALDNVTSGLLTGAKANAITREPFVVYLSGVDTRGELTENARSDVNILAAVNPVTKRVALVNTPRDYYVDLAGTDAKDKLTHAGLYGVEASMQTLGKLYGVEVGQYVRINFAGFMQVVDALGGVDVYSDYAFTSVGSPGYYDPTTFAEGWNHLDGKAALAFARERHAFASGDVQRGINQMKVIDAMLDKIKSPALLMGFSRLMEAAGDCFVTSFSPDQISALVRMQLSDLAAWDIQSYTATGANGSSSQCYSARGQKLYVMQPDPASVSEAAALIQSVLGGEAAPEDGSAPAAGQPAHSAAPSPEAPASTADIPDEPQPEPGPEAEPASSEPAGPEPDPASEAPSAPAESEPAGPEAPAESGSEPPAEPAPDGGEAAASSNPLEEFWDMVGSLAGSIADSLAATESAAS